MFFTSTSGSGPSATGADDADADGAAALADGWGAGSAADGGALGGAAAEGIEDGTVGADDDGGALEAAPGFAGFDEQAATSSSNREGPRSGARVGIGRGIAGTRTLTKSSRDRTDGRRADSGATPESGARSSFT